MAPAFESPTGLAALFLAGAVASAVNAIAGGGSLVSFPALIGLGMPELPANATNSVALWPGSMASAIGFLGLFDRVKGHLKTLIAPTIAGSVLGAWLLVTTPGAVFRLLVPWLVLGAVLLLLAQPWIRAKATAGSRRGTVWGGAVLQFFVSVYGGYFGAGMGIMMLAVIGLIGDHDLHEMNALKNWLAVIINVAASSMFIVQGLVVWGPCLALLAGAVLGGYASARLSQKVASDTLRRWVVGYGFLMAGWFFWRAYA